jgi:hypothetical protein
VRVLEDWCSPFPGYFLYYPSRRRQPAALSALIETLRLRKYRTPPEAAAPRADAGYVPVPLQRALLVHGEVAAQSRATCGFFSLGAGSRRRSAGFSHGLRPATDPPHRQAPWLERPRPLQAPCRATSVMRTRPSGRCSTRFWAIAGRTSPAKESLHAPNQALQHLAHFAGPKVRSVGLDFDPDPRGGARASVRAGQRLLEDGRPADTAVAATGPTSRPARHSRSHELHLPRQPKQLASPIWGTIRKG